MKNIIINNALHLLLAYAVRSKIKEFQICLKVNHDTFDILYKFL